MTVEIIKIVGIAFITLIAYIIVKPLKPELAIFISIIGVCIVLVSCIDGLLVVIESMTLFVQKTGIDSKLFACVLKVVGIGYVVEFSANLCNNAGNSAIADAVSIAGKITILVVSLPILTSLLNLIIEILP